jgi:hypothetical protein
MLEVTLAIHSQRKIVWRRGLQVEGVSVFTTLAALRTSWGLLVFWNLWIS